MRMPSLNKDRRWRPSWWPCSKAAPNFWIWGSNKNTWPNKRIMLKLTRSNNMPMELRTMNVLNMLRMSKRRFKLLRLIWLASSRRKWMRCARNWTVVWKNVTNSVSSNTTRSCKDTKMWRKKSRISKRSSNKNGSANTKYRRDPQPLSHNAAAQWQWAKCNRQARCNQLWNQSQLASHPTTERGKTQIRNW